MIMRLKCEVGCDKLQLGPPLGKNEITFRTTQYMLVFRIRFPESQRATFTSVRTTSLLSKHVIYCLWNWKSIESKAFYQQIFRLWQE